MHILLLRLSPVALRTRRIRVVESERGQQGHIRIRIRIRILNTLILARFLGVDPRLCIRVLDRGDLDIRIRIRCIRYIRYIRGHILVLRMGKGVVLLLCTCRT